MATKETADLGAVHPPKAESIKAFKEIEHELKHELVKLRHQHDKHEKEYFAAVADLSDADLAGFSADDFEAVRVAATAYGLILFGKLRIPAQPGAYLHFRAYSAGPDDEAKFHSFHTEETEEADGNKKFRAIFTKNDELDWFDT